MPSQRQLHVIHLLIRSQAQGLVRFLVYPHDKWKDAAGQPYWTLPAKKTVSEPFAPYLQGSSMEHFLEDVIEQDLKLAKHQYALEQEIEPTVTEFAPPGRAESTQYTIYPVDVWVQPDCHDALRAGVQGKWLSCDEAIALPLLSPTAKAVFQLIKDREKALEEKYAQNPKMEQKPNEPRRLLNQVPDRPTMDALAQKWLSHNRQGVRHLRKQELDDILAVGARAFNLRVADPYLRYQLQGVGFTWSFFTHKDPQDIHVHGAPVVEIYGVLEGRLEVWWKPYYDRGTSAWCRRILEPGDWLEVDSLQCHIVRWQGEGKGVVFKAGPGPLAEVGRLGITGKTRCDECPCMKPAEVNLWNKGAESKVAKTDKKNPT